MLVECREIVKMISQCIYLKKTGGHSRDDALGAYLGHNLFQFLGEFFLFGLYDKHPDVSQICCL